MGNRSTKTEPLQDSEIASKHGTIGKEGDMPDPFPSVRKKKDILQKVNFRTIDEKTCKVPPTLLFGSFWDLVEHLVIATNFEELDDLFRVRAIFRYMTLYNVFNIESDILPPPGSPLEYLLKIQWEFGDHAHMFWALCSMANIPCVIINGITKHGLYELGEKIDREKLQSRWNAVFINGEWRLLDVFWATSYSEDHERYDKITVDDDGNIKHETNFDGQSNNHLLDEYYFLTDPEELIYTHLPDDPSWQLLDSTLTLEQFQRQPYLRERFFELEMKIPANQKSRKCFFRSKGKPIVVSFDLPEKRCKNYQFKYDLMQTRFDHDQDKEVSIVLDRYVMMEKIKSTLKFTLLLPLQGVFRFDVYGLDTKLQDEPKLVCSYGILGTVTTKCEPFPTQPGHGWGVNPDYAHLGIEPVRPTDAYIMTETGFVEVLLKTSGDAKLSHVLKSATAEDIPLSRHAIGRFQNGEYSINIRLPKDGNYSLNIFTPVNGESVSILSYLIMCNSEKVQNQPFPSVLGTQLGIKVGAETLGIRLADGLSDLMVAWNGELQLDFSVPENVTLCYELNANDSVAKNKMKGSETRNGATSQYNVDVPVKGIYTINVFGYETDFPGKMSEVFSGFIHSTGKSEIYEELKPKPVKNMSKKKQESKDTNQGKGNKTSKKDLGEFDEIITTSVSNVTIPIPKSSGSLFTTLRRCGTTEEEENNDATVSVHNDTMEVRMRKEADYLLSIFAKHPNDVIQSIGRYTICYTKDASNKKSNLKEGKENIEGNDEDADLPFISSGGFITYREEDFKGKGVRPPLQNTYPEQANSKLNQANKTKSKQKTSMKMPRASENSEESPRRQPTMKELDSLVKSLHSQYSVQLPSKPIGLDAYFDAKDTEKAREDLSFACRHREPTMLEEAIDRAKEANESTQKLSTQIVVASRLLMRLSKIDQSSYRLQAVDNKSLAEVKQYQTPPYGVHHSVAATFLLLGDDIESLKTWSKCQALMCQMGKRYIFRRMSKLNPKDVDDNSVKAAKNILKPFSRVQIRDVSKGAACLYAWVKGVIREHGGTGSSEGLQSRPTTQMRPRSSSRPAYKKTHDRALVINM